MRTSFTSAALFTTLATIAPAAFAQPADPAAVTATAPATAAIDGDPNIDRGFLLPTAMTQPAGSLTYNNYELLLHGLTYGLTDRVQLSATVLSPLTKDFPFFGMAAVKGRIYTGERLHLALQGSASWIHLFGDSDDDVALVGAGALASYCLRADCSTLVSASATYQRAFASGTDQSEQTVVYGASVVHRVGRHVKLLGEVTSAGVYGTSNEDFENLDGLLVSYGVRFHGSNLAADVGFMKPVSSDGDFDDTFLLGLPFVNLSYRW